MSSHVRVLSGCFSDAAPNLTSVLHIHSSVNNGRTHCFAKLLLQFLVGVRTQSRGEKSVMKVSQLDTSNIGSRHRVCICTVKYFTLQKDGTAHRYTPVCSAAPVWEPGHSSTRCEPLLLPGSWRTQGRSIGNGAHRLFIFIHDDNICF